MVETSQAIQALHDVEQRNSAKTNARNVGRKNKW